MLQIMHIVLANHFLIKIKSTVVLKTSTYIYIRTLLTSYFYNYKLKFTSTCNNSMIKNTSKKTFTTEI